MFGVSERYRYRRPQPWSPQVVLLDNGCLCCTVRSDLVEAVKQILLKVPRVVPAESDEKWADFRC